MHMRLRWKLKLEEDLTVKVFIFVRFHLIIFFAVWKGKLRSKLVAVKRLFASLSDEKGLEAFKKEVSIMRY